jgi:hypothetical protein
MLTYRTGAAGSPSAAKAMAEHLGEQTLPADKVELAQHYQRGMVAEFDAELGQDVFAGEAMKLLRAGTVLGELQDALAAAVIGRHSEFVGAAMAGAHRDMDEAAVLAAFAEFVTVSDEPGAEAAEVEYRLTEELESRIFELRHKLGWAERHGLRDRIDDVQAWQREAAELGAERDRIAGAFGEALAAASHRFDTVLEAAETALHGRTLPEPRRDTHPRLAALLGMDPNRPPTMEEVANLLNGQRADGGDIESKQKQRATAALDEALGLDPKQVPTSKQVAHVLAGRRADGQALEGPDARSVRGRFLRLMGVEGGREPIEVQAANLLAGRRADGSELDLAAYERGVTASRTRIGYIDLCFSADKSLSVAWAFAPTEAERNIIAQVHRDAVDSAVRYVAAEIGHVRKGKAGKDGTEPGHVAWILFDHYASRSTVEVARTDEHGRPYTELLTMKAAGDPQLHTHVAVPNVVLTATGRVGAMDLDVLEGRVREFGAYYQAHVATNLRRHGVEVVLDERTGAARLAAIPDRVRDAFSKRTRDGTEAAREYASGLGLDWDALSPERKTGLIKGGTQKHKLAKTEGMSDEDREAFERGARKDDKGDFAAWQRQAAAMGWEHQGVLQPDQVRPERSRDERLEHAYQTALRLLEKEWERRARMDGEDLRVVAARALVASGVEEAADIGSITRAFATRGVRQAGQDTSLIWGEDVPVRGKARIGVTTALHEVQEEELVALARAATGDRSAALSAAAITRAIARREAMPLGEGGLRFQDAHGEAQREVMEQLGRGGRLSVAIGVAGAGKSALLAPLVDAWREDGRKVYGAALAWRQSDELAGAGIAEGDRTALARFLKRAETGAIRLDRSSVVVVDELGLVGTRQMLDVMRLQARHGFQLVTVGDPKQCQSIEAGPVISILQRALGEDAIPELLTTMRQATERERETSLMFREGRAKEALDAKREDGTAVLVPGGYREAVEHVAALWRARLEANAADPTFILTVSAPTNADAREIATAIREQRRAMGQLGADERVLNATDQAGVQFDLPLAVGDRVRLFDRATASFTDMGTHGNIGNNGSVLEVREIGDAGLVLRNTAGREGLVRWGTLHDRESGRVRLTYGDVLSIDAIQSATSTEHINAMPAGSQAVNAFKGYTANSRHRRTTWLVTSDGAERQEVTRRRPLGGQRQVREKDVWDNVARNLAREPEKGSALAFLERAHELRRGAARALQEGLQPGEAREARGQPRSTLAGTFARRRNETRVEATGVGELLATLARSQTDMLDRLAQLGPMIRGAVAAAVERVKPVLRRLSPRREAGSAGPVESVQDPQEGRKAAPRTPTPPTTRSRQDTAPLAAEGARAAGQVQRDAGRQHRGAHPLDDSQAHRQRAAVRPDAGAPTTATQQDRDAARQRRAARKTDEAQMNRQRTAAAREQTRQASRKGPRLR